MVGYNESVEVKMVSLFQSLSEKDRRRYAAVEAEKLGHGGVEYIAGLFGCDPKTIRRGIREIAELPHDEADGRVHRKGGAGEMLAFPSRESLRRSAKKLKPTLPGRL